MIAPREVARLLVAAVLVVTLPSGRAAAEERRKVAVLEYRAGVEQASDLGAHLAERLRTTAALVVIDPVEARRRFPHTDGQTARCSGDAACLARLGAALEVDEILLVGISKLGDVVMALQRIDVESAKVSAQLSDVLPDDGALDDEKLDGWLKRLYPPEVFKRYGFIAVTANVAGAVVTINGQSKGETPLEGKLKVLAPHSYRVELRKPDFAPFAARIDVPPDATVEVRAELSHSSLPTPWFKRWYLWAIAGGVVAAGAAGALIYSLQPDPTMVMGFIQR